MNNNFSNTIDDKEPVYIQHQQNTGIIQSFLPWLNTSIPTTPTSTPKNLLSITCNKTPSSPQNIIGRSPNSKARREQKMNEDIQALLQYHSKYSYAYFCDRLLQCEPMMEFLYKKLRLIRKLLYEENYSEQYKKIRLKRMFHTEDINSNQQKHTIQSIKESTTIKQCIKIIHTFLQNFTQELLKYPSFIYIIPPPLNYLQRSFLSHYFPYCECLLRSKSVSDDTIEDDVITTLSQNSIQNTFIESIYTVKSDTPKNTVKDNILKNTVKDNTLKNIVKSDTPKKIDLLVDNKVPLISTTTTTDTQNSKVIDNETYKQYIQKHTERICIEYMHDQFYLSDISNLWEKEYILQRKMFSLQILTYHDFDIPKEQYDIDIITKSVSYIRALRYFRAPIDKMNCILHSCKILYDLFQIKQVNTSKMSADSLLPIIIYTILTARPEGIIIDCHYISNVQHPLILHGENEYYITLILSSIDYILQYDVRDHRKKSDKSTTLFYHLCESGKELFDSLYISTNSEYESIDMYSKDISISISSDQHHEQYNKYTKYSFINTLPFDKEKQYTDIDIYTVILYTEKTIQQYLENKDIQYENITIDIESFSDDNNNNIKLTYKTVSCTINNTKNILISTYLIRENFSLLCTMYPYHDMTLLYLLPKKLLYCRIVPTITIHSELYNNNTNIIYNDDNYKNKNIVDTIFCTAIRQIDTYFDIPNDILQDYDTNPYYKFKTFSPRSSSIYANKGYSPDIKEDNTFSVDDTSTLSILKQNSLSLYDTTPYNTPKKDNIIELPSNLQFYHSITYDDSTIIYDRMLCMEEIYRKIVNTSQDRIQYQNKLLQQNFIFPIFIRRNLQKYIIHHHTTNDTLKQKIEYLNNDKNINSNTNEPTPISFNLLQTKQFCKDSTPYIHNIHSIIVSIYTILDMYVQKPIDTKHHLTYSTIPTQNHIIKKRIVQTFLNLLYRLCHEQVYTNNPLNGSNGIHHLPQQIDHHKFTKEELETILLLYERIAYIIIHLQWCLITLSQQ